MDAEIQNNGHRLANSIQVGSLKIWMVICVLKIIFIIPILALKMTICDKLIKYLLFGYIIHAIFIIIFGRKLLIYRRALNNQQMVNLSQGFGFRRIVECFYGYRVQMEGVDQEILRKKTYKTIIIWQINRMYLLIYLLQHTDRCLAALVIWNQHINNHSSCFNGSKNVLLKRILSVYLVLGFAHCFQVFLVVGLLICCLPVILYYTYYTKTSAYDSQVLYALVNQCLFIKRSVDKYIQLEQYEINDVEEQDLENNVQECLICRMDFEQGDSFIRLKCCDKIFYHKQCLIEWLKSKNECPICKRLIDDFFFEEFYEMEQ